MTNFEKHKDDIINIIKENGTAFALDKETKKPVACSMTGIRCSQCAFNGSKADCSDARKEWLDATVYDSAIYAKDIYKTLPDDILDAIQTLYKARSLACELHDCNECRLQPITWCYEISLIEAFFHVMGPELAEQVQRQLLIWLENVKENHPEYLLDRRNKYGY